MKLPWGRRRARETRGPSRSRRCRPTTRITSGTILPNARNTAVRAPALTPATLIQVRNTSTDDDRRRLAEPVIRAGPQVAHGPREKQPKGWRSRRRGRSRSSSRPRNRRTRRRPRACRRIAPPGLSKRLPASAKQRTSSSTAKPAARIAQTLAGPRSAAAATGRIEVHAAPDDVVDRERHDLPPGDGAQKPGGCGAAEAQRLRQIVPGF